MRANKSHKTPSIVSISYPFPRVCRGVGYEPNRKVMTTIDFTDGVGFEPTVRYKRTHTFQSGQAYARNIVLRAVSALKGSSTISERAESRPKPAPHRIHFVSSAPDFSSFSRFAGPAVQLLSSIVSTILTTNSYPLCAESGAWV